MEYNAIKLLIRLLEEDKTPAAPGFTLHVAHLSDSGALPMIQAAKKKGAIFVSLSYPLLRDFSAAQQSLSCARKGCVSKAEATAMPCSSSALYSYCTCSTGPWKTT